MTDIVKVYDNSGREVHLVSKIGKGGEGTTYLTNDQKVAKIYNNNKLTADKEEKLKLMVQQRICMSGVCWPEKLLYDGSKFIGYVMPKAIGKEMQKCLFIKPLLLQNFPNWNRVDLASLCISMLEKIIHLHDHGIIIGDINPLNILIAENGDVYFVDADSYQIGAFPCPVGTVNFTAPEIQGRDYKTFLRTKDHEYFAIATLLFMTLLPGKPPYSFQGGGNPGENIRARNFSYPFADEVNYKAPAGPWEFIWNDLSYEVKKGFHEVFKGGAKIDARQWLEILINYKSQLHRNLCAIDIFPTDDSSKLVDNVSISMNRKSKSLGEDLTILNKNLPDKIGVLELSTKAVKFLYGDASKLKDGFDFDKFKREADLVNAGKGLEADNTMNLNYFRSRVLPSIKNMVSKAHNAGITKMFGVATAAYRSATNNDEILKIIKQETGVNIKIISKDEEAMATLDAFIFSGTAVFSKLKQDIILIDQGGGSTEVVWFNRDNIEQQYSVNLGTTVLHNMLLVNTNSDTPISRALSDIDKAVKDKLAYYLSEYKIDSDREKSCISVGTAITKSTGKKGNKKQHLTILKRDDLQRKITSLEDRLVNQYSTMGKLADAMRLLGNSNDELDGDITMRLGLPMYLHLMDRFNINDVIVSGTGLWYGVYYRKMKDNNLL